MTLTDFLLARIAEDEATFGAAVEAEVQNLRRDGMSDVTITEIREFWLRPDSAHWGRRLLAECEAKRRIVELHKPVTDPAWPEQVFCDELETGADSAYPCPTIRILAAIYAEHPDYREEWKP